MSDVPAVADQYVGERASQVETVMIEGEALLLDERDGRAHVLNSTAAIVWQCFDGEATLREICRDISDELGIDYEQILADSSAITTQLLELGVVVAGDGEPGHAEDEHDDAPVQEYREYLDHQFTLGDEGVLAVRAGDHTVVVRSNDASMLALLGRALAPLVVERTDGPADVSLLFGPRRGHIRGSHFLYASDRLMLHTKSEGRLLRAAIRHVAGAGRPSGDVRRVRARLLRNRQSALLVTSLSGPLPDLNGRRAARYGWGVVDVDAPYLDVDHAEAVCSASLFDSEPDALHEINLRFPPEPGESLTGPVRAPVVGLVVLGGDTPWTRGDSPGRRAAAMVPFVDGTADLQVRTETLLAVTELAAKVPVRVLPDWQEHALSAILSPSGLRGTHTRR